MKFHKGSWHAGIMRKSWISLVFTLSLGRWHLSSLPITTLPYMMLVIFQAAHLSVPGKLLFTNFKVRKHPNEQFPLNLRNIPQEGKRGRWQNGSLTLSGISQVEPNSKVTLQLCFNNYWGTYCILHKTWLSDSYEAVMGECSSFTVTSQALDQATVKPCLK